MRVMLKRGKVVSLLDVFKTDKNKFFKKQIENGLRFVPLTLLGPKMRAAPETPRLNSQQRNRIRERS